MTDFSGTPGYWRYQPPEAIVMGEPDWLVPGCCYKGVVPTRAFGFVLLFGPDGEEPVEVAARQVERVTEELYRAEGGRG